MSPFPILLVIFVLLSVGRAESAPMPQLSCDQIRQMMQGHSLDEAIAEARQRGVPEQVIRRYIRRCHLG